MIIGHCNFHLCTQLHFLNSLMWILVSRNEGYLKGGYRVLICSLLTQAFLLILHIIAFTSQLHSNLKLLIDSRV